MRTIGIYAAGVIVMKKTLTNPMFFGRIKQVLQKSGMLRIVRSPLSALFTILLLLSVIGCETIDVSDGCLKYAGTSKFYRCNKIMQEKGRSLNPDLETIEDIKECNKYTRMITRNTCIIEFASREAMANGRPALCEEIDRAVGQESVGLKDACYYRYAIGNRDPEICELVKGAGVYSRRGCIETIAYNTSEAQLCILINDPYHQFACVNYLATELKQPDLCNLLKDRKHHGVCVGNMAKNLRNPELCNNIDIEFFDEELGNLRARCMRESKSIT